MPTPKCTIGALKTWRNTYQIGILPFMHMPWHHLTSLNNGQRFCYCQAHDLWRVGLQSIHDATKQALVNSSRKRSKMPELCLSLLGKTVVTRARSLGPLASHSLEGELELRLWSSHHLCFIFPGKAWAQQHIDAARPTKAVKVPLLLTVRS